MITDRRRELFVLLLGDITIFLLSLFLVLLLRYGSILDSQYFLAHLISFSFLSLLWVFVFFVFGLYERHTLLFKKGLPPLLFSAQALNIVLAATFFYLIPFFDITPKTNLFLYLGVSSILLFFFRMYGVSFFDPKKKLSALLLFSSDDARRLRDEINQNKTSRLQIISMINHDAQSGQSLEKRVCREIREKNIDVMIADFEAPDTNALSLALYPFLYSNVQFLDVKDLYENTFTRISLELLSPSWFLKNIRSSHSLVYRSTKRFLDIAISFSLTILTLPIYPFVYLAIKLDDGGPIFIVQKRIGKQQASIYLIKIRTMRVGKSTKWLRENDTRVTRVGKFLRASRMDELPQLLNVLKGDLSLVGPRPDVVGNYKKLSENIPFYSIRYLVKPGLSGWAQIKQPSPQSVKETELRLAYDLYYVKNPSFFLDLKIALLTIKTLLARTGI